MTPEELQLAAWDRFRESMDRHVRATEAGTLATEAGTRATEEGTRDTRRVVKVLWFTAGLMVALAGYREWRSSKQDERQEAFAARLEEIAAQVATVQATADSTKDAVTEIEERPTFDLEIVDAPASASSGPAQPTAALVFKKQRPSALQPSVSITIPIPLPSAPPSAPAPEPKR